MTAATVEHAETPAQTTEASASKGNASCLVLLNLPGAMDNASIHSETPKTVESAEMSAHQA
jgi:hypothetical protein